MTTLRDRLLAAPARPAGELTLPEMGGVTVSLRRWTLGDRLRAQQVSDDKSRSGAARAGELLRLSLADADNRPVFAEGDEGLLAFPGDLAERVILAALDANGLGPGAADRGKATSPPTPS